MSMISIMSIALILLLPFSRIFVLISRVTSASTLGILLITVIPIVRAGITIVAINHHNDYYHHYYHYEGYYYYFTIYIMLYSCYCYQYCY